MLQIPPFLADDKLVAALAEPLALRCGLAPTTKKYPTASAIISLPIILYVR